MFRTSKLVVSMTALLLFVSLVPQLGAQLIPRGAHVNLYFPHIANSG